MEALKNPQEAFRWIVSVLEKHKIGYVISGGLAAKNYGSPRLLKDIDIEVHSRDFEKILPDIKPYIVFGPAQFQDEKWDLPLITLDHHGQQIDISGGDQTRIYNSVSRHWEHVRTDFTDVENREIFGLTVPALSAHQLIAYKSILNRDYQQIDAIDIQAAREHLKKGSQ
ncbi:MAG: hypothetical protein M3O22_03425 [Pseudomonadota bacterium]|nr:hypothetical protein [Pseudomonadota bacterium]